MAEILQGVATVRTSLVKLTESVTSASASTEIDASIDEARNAGPPREAQLVIPLLNRIQRTKGGELSAWHRFRILSQYSAAAGQNSRCDRHFKMPSPRGPDDELAAANEVLAYHLLGQDEETQ